MALYDTLNEEKRDHYLPAFEAFEQLVGQLASAESADKSFGDIEALIEQKGMEVFRQLAQGQLNQRHTEEDKLEALVDADGSSRGHRREDCRRQVECLFGEVEAHRIGYRGCDLGMRYPLDAQLNFSPDKYSQGLRREIAHLVATQSFDEAQEALIRRGGGRLPKRQLQAVSATLIRDFDAFYNQPLEASNPAQPILVITADGKGVSVYNQDLREATRKVAQADQKKKRKRLQPGEKRSRKRMATVVSVYEIAPYYRTPEQLLTHKEDPPPVRPKPENKRVWAGLVDDMGTLIKQGFQEAIRRDPEQTLHWVVLIDGQAELIRQVERQAKLYQVDVTLTQDFLHVTEYLWKASHALHPDSADKREQWVSERSLELLRGNAKNVASGLRRAATRHGLSDPQRAPVDTAADYIENSQHRLRYDESLTHGFPIASGVIEGACRYLVKDRMDLTGARWRLISAEAVLKLRSLKASGDLDDYLQFHFQQEKERNYPWAANDEIYAAVA